MKEITLSVIVPVYNMEKYLGTCLDSILDQEIPNMEVLVVDAGSTDRSRDVIKRYAKQYEQIQQIYSDQNLWASAARNLALDRAKGKYLAFCDADDTIPTGAYKKLIKSAEENQSDIVTADYTHRYRDGIRGDSIYRRDDPFERCLENCNISFCNKLFRRSFVADVRFPEELRTAEDGLFTLRLYRKNPKVSCINEIVYVYTVEKQDEKENEAHAVWQNNFDSIKDSATLLMEIFCTPFDGHLHQWATFYMDYLAFIQGCLWTMIKDPYQKKAAYECIHDTILKLSEKNSVCNFAKNNYEVEFGQVFCIEYVHYVFLSYEQFAMVKEAKAKTVSVASADVSNAFIRACKTGKIGMRTIFQAIKAWFEYKIGKKKG